MMTSSPLKASILLKKFLATCNWNGNDTSSHLLWNPTTPPTYLAELQKAISAWSGHVWLATSGSSRLKWVGLAKEALFASATAVNAHLQSTSQDHWLLALPTFHVGGLGVEIRAYLSGASLTYFPLPKWDPFVFSSICQEKQITLSSLVPAQLFDLALHGLLPSPSLRAVLVGGGPLSLSVYEKARQLGWPILPTYGLTECASQVATAPLQSRDSEKESEFPPFVPLAHLQIRVENGMLCFKGPSLLTGYFTEEGGVLSFFDPKENGWFQSEDRGDIQEGRLLIHGRSLDFWKIGGENICLSALQEILDRIRMQIGCLADVALVPVPDPRLSYVIGLAHTPMEPALLQTLVRAFAKEVPPFARIRKQYELPSLPRSPLKKLYLTILQQKCDHTLCEPF